MLHSFIVSVIATFIQAMWLPNPRTKGFRNQNLDSVFGIDAMKICPIPGIHFIEQFCVGSFVIISPKI